MHFIGCSGKFGVLRKNFGAPTYAHFWGRAISLYKMFLKILNGLGGVALEQQL